MWVLEEPSDNSAGASVTSPATMSAYVNTSGRAGQRFALGMTTPDTIQHLCIQEHPMEVSVIYAIIALYLATRVFYMLQICHIILRDHALYEGEKACMVAIGSMEAARSYDVGWGFKHPVVGVV